ncbi:hypothetical protein Hanom_Chr06g00535691 [Helianthus anomalus]
MLILELTHTKPHPQLRHSHFTTTRHLSILPFPSPFPATNTYTSPPLSLSPTRALSFSHLIGTPTSFSDRPTPHLSLVVFLRRHDDEI